MKATRQHTYIVNATRQFNLIRWEMFILLNIIFPQYALFDTLLFSITYLYDACIFIFRRISKMCYSVDCENCHKSAVVISNFFIHFLMFFFWFESQDLNFHLGISSFCHYCLFEFEYLKCFRMNEKGRFVILSSWNDGCKRDNSKRI